MTRKYSSTSISALLKNTINSTATSMEVTTSAGGAGAGAALLGGVTLGVGGVDQFTLVIDPDTINEEIVFATQLSVDTFTISRGQARTGTAGVSGVSHTAGATIKHVLTGDDLDYFTAGVVTGKVTAKGDLVVATGSGAVSRLAVGANDYVLTADSTTATGVKWAVGGDITSVVASTGLSGGATSGVATLSIDTATTVDKTTAQTLTNKKLTTPKETITVSATAATGTVHLDTVTQAVLYYTSNASANWTMNIRGNSTTTLDSLMSTGDSVTVVFLNTNGATAYYPSSFTIDGSAVTPKWATGTTPIYGNASSIDSYTYTIVKTGSAVFTVLASQVQFK